VLPGAALTPHTAIERLPSSLVERLEFEQHEKQLIRLPHMKNLASIEGLLLESSCTLDRICIELANLFGVRCTEIGVLRLEGEFLRFLYPAELQVAGRIPISGSAVAAKTARTRKSELFNNFATVPHRTVFELVKLKVPEATDEEPPRIQKLMSAPILGEQNSLLGVVQVSRKGPHPAAAGPDFTSEELEDLEFTVCRVATLKPEVLFGEPKRPRWFLALHNEQKKKTRASRRG